jgi:predicted NACHT family NTPase
VLGRPGAGKSVLLQEHALELARGEPPTRIPVFVRLRELIDESADADFVDFAVGRQTGVGSARPAMSGPTVQTLRIAVGQRRVVFLLDGLDEVPPARRDALLRRVARSVSNRSVRS